MKEKTAAEWFAAARESREKAEFAVAAVRDEARRAAILEDSRKPKPTTEPGRLLRRAEHAETRAEAEKEKEKEKAEKFAERKRKEAEKEAERARKEQQRLGERARKEKEAALARARKEAAAFALAEEKKRKEEERFAEKARKEEELALAKLRKEEEKEKARLARETALMEAALEKEKARLERETALAESKARREAALETERLEKEAERARKEEEKKIAENASVPSLVRFLLKNPRMNRDAVVAGFLAEHPQTEFLTKVTVRSMISQFAETSSTNPNDPLRNWLVNPEGLAAAGLTYEQAEGLRPEVALTNEERLLMEKKKKEASRKAEEARKAALKEKQASVLKGFFASAPKKRLAPETVTFAPPKPVALDASAERAFVEAVMSTREGACQATSETNRESFLRLWKTSERTRVSALGDSSAPESVVGGSRVAGRWGRRRGAKRARAGTDATLLAASPGAGDAATRVAIERSLADAENSRDGSGRFAFSSLPPAKRRKLLSVDCSSEYAADDAGTREIGGGSCQYRFGFQLGMDQLDSIAEMRKTFPVSGGRPAFWGSGALRRFRSAEASGAPPAGAATGRRPFARDPRVAYVDDSGLFFDSGDEWEEPEEGENLDGSDLDEEDEEEKLACTGTSDDEREEGFVVPDGYLSAEENAGRGEDELGEEDVEMDSGVQVCGVEDDPVAIGSDAVGGFARRVREDTPAARAARERRVESFARKMARARRRNEPLVVSLFGSFRADPNENDLNDLNDSNDPDARGLLSALDIAPFPNPRSTNGFGVHEKEPRVRLYAPPLAGAERAAAEAAALAEEKAALVEEKRRLEQARLAEKARKEEARETKRREALEKKSEKAREKAERDARKKRKADEKASRAAEKAAKLAKIFSAKLFATTHGSTPSKGSSETLPNASGGERVSPIKSLFERAVAATATTTATAAAAAAAEATASASLNADVAADPERVASPPRDADARCA